MNTKSIIEIFRGDDSDALGYQTIVGTIHTDLDLAGCKAVFRYLGFFQEFDPIPEDGKLTIVIPSASSIQFPPGLGYASLKVYDIDRKVRTFTNRIPVFVSTKTPCRCGCEFDVEFSPFPELEPLKIFIGPNADDFDQYTGFVSKIIDRASLVKYGLAILADAMSEDGGASGKAASPLAVKAAYDAIIKELVDNYYTAEQTEEAIDRVAAYYITYTAAGSAFPTYAALANATTVYSGGKVRIPTRNDYCVVLADETHQGAEYRYIYAVAEGETTGSWQPQFPVEGVMTVDQTVTKNSTNPVTGGGVWSAIWGMATTAFSSIYDWVVSRLSEYRDKLDLNVYGLGNASVTFPDGFSITYMDDTYVASIGGETIEFYGPITSTAVPQYNFWVPYDFKDRTDFDPQEQAEWCLFGGPTPYSLMYRNGASYSIANWNTEAPTLTLSNGEASGGEPTMTRPVGATGDTLAKASQLAGKQDALSQTQLANIAAVSDALSFDATHSYAAGDPVVYNGTLYTFTATHTGAWTGSDVSAVDIIARLALKANDNAVVHLTGDQTIGGVKSFVDGVHIRLNRTDSDFQIEDPSGNLGTFTITNSMATGRWCFFARYWDNSICIASLPVNSGTLARIEDLAPDFSSSATYAVNALCIHESVLYRCTTAITTAENWTPAHWTQATVEDVLAALRTAIAGKADVSAIPYDRITITTGQLQDHAVQKVTLNAATTTLVLPALTDLTGKVSDFGIDVVNGYEVSGTPTAASFSLAGTIGTDYNLIVPEGEDWSEMSALAAGEMAQFYFTLSAFAINDKPTWKIVKQTVELVPVPVAP